MNIKIATIVLAILWLQVTVRKSRTKTILSHPQLHSSKANLRHRPKRLHPSRLLPSKRTLARLHRRPRQLRPIPKSASQFERNESRLRKLRRELNQEKWWCETAVRAIPHRNSRRE